VELYLHSPNTPSWCGAQLKHRDNFYILPAVKSLDFVVKFGERKYILVGKPQRKIKFGRSRSNGRIILK
jgi:hypothetical protein